MTFFEAIKALAEGKSISSKQAGVTNLMFLCDTLVVANPRNNHMDNYTLTKKALEAEDWVVTNQQEE